MAKISKGVKINIYSSNSFGRSKETVMLETSLSKVAELQSGKRKITLSVLMFKFEFLNALLFIQKKLITVFVL
jgi:hypothetical protein